MFDSIVYKNKIGPGPLIDIGALAESLLFYGRVAIVGNTGTVRDILSRIPPFIFLSLLRDGRIEFHYLSDQIGVSATQMSNGRSLHSLVNFSSPDHTIEKIGPKEFKAAAGGSGQARIGASKFTKLLRPLDHSGFDQASLLEALSDNVAIEASVESLIQTVVPDFLHSESLRFRIEREKQGFYVDTNIDFNRLNERYHTVIPATHSTLTESYILALLQGAYESTYFAGVLDSEVAVAPLESVIQAKAVEAIVKRYKHSESQIESFFDLTLDNSHVIREAVNSGAVSFISVVKLLEAADKFRHWLQQQPVDANLIKAYYQETIKASWVEKLPTKSARWSVFTGVGLSIDMLGAGGLGTAAGVAVSAVDSFLVDKLIGGWKPHQFVESELKSLLAPYKKIKSK